MVSDTGATYSVLLLASFFRILSVQINRGSPAADSSSFYHLHSQGIASQVQSGLDYLGVGLMSESVSESILA